MARTKAASKRLSGSRKKSLKADPKEVAVRVDPFLKWAGGKRRLMPQYEPYLPKTFGRYHEPFVGGGAFFFHIHPEVACLSDINPRLVDTYTSIRDDIDGLVERLALHKKHHNKRYYYERRDEFNHGALFATDRAALMIYLNKTCFNGLYRENLKGHFNVPMGRYKSPSIFSEEHLRSVHKRLQQVEIHNEAFEGVLERAEAGDLVFFDPPYVPISETSSFTNYSKDGFGAQQQRRLAEVFGLLVERGCHVMLSNSDCPFVRELYKDWEIVSVSAARCINSRATHRGAITEVLVLGGPA